MGIGGAGMSAIARLMQASGYDVSGDDQAESAVLVALRAEGIPCHASHSIEHLIGVDAIAPSSAINPAEPELVEARRRGLKIWHRGDLLHALMQDKIGIAIAGTHGKTTTTDMVAKILLDHGQDPSYIVGGQSTSLPSNARVGSGSAFVVEADEYDRTFLRLAPTVAVVCNAEFDHPDIFADLEDTLGAFTQFACSLPSDGALVWCADDPGAVTVAERARSAAAIEHKDSITFTDYGLDRGAWRARNIRGNPLGGFDYRLQSFDARSAEVSLRVPGVHNILNSMAALIVADLAGVPLDAAAESLGGYHGAARRFELKGEKRGVRYIDDYAHNPAKIRAALSGARARYPVGNIWALWQPHTYSRTLALMDDFARSFREADHVLVLPIYGAREKLSDFGADSDRLNPISIGRMIKHPDVRSCASIDNAVGLLTATLRPGDVLVSLSAGDGNQVLDRLLQ